jgi:hypothetical protein
VQIDMSAAKIASSADELAARLTRGQDAAGLEDLGELMIGQAPCCVCLMVLLMHFFVMTAAVAQQTPEQQAVHLQEEAQRLYGGGQYQAGINMAKRAVAFGEKALGPEHPAVALSLQTLGQL